MARHTANNPGMGYGHAARAGAGCLTQIALVVLGLGLAWLLLSTLVSAFDPLERERRASEMYYAEQRRADTYDQIVFRDRALTIGAGIGGAVLLVGGAGVALLMVYRRWTLMESIRAQHQIAHTRAATQLFPPGLESLSFHDSHRVEAAPMPPMLEAEQVEADVATVPTFSALLDAGVIGPGRPMILGFDRETGEPVAGSWLDLYSTAVGGLSGTGKTWTATFLACQAILHGSRLLILDPHAENPESLSARLAPLRARFVCDPATTTSEMLAAVKLAAGELKRRKEPGGYTRGTAPIVMAADEFAALQRGELADPLAALMEALGQEGRKLDLFGMICSQVWSAERAGGTPLRDSLASAYIHRLRPAQARMMSGLTSADLPNDLFSLPKAHAYLITTAGELRPVIIPQMTSDDVARVAAMAGGAAPSVPTSERRPIGFRPEVGSEVGSEVGTRAPLRPRPDAEKLTPEEAEILAAFLAGKTVTDIAAEMSGQKGGEKYQKAARRISEVLRKALEGVRS